MLNWRVYYGDGSTFSNEDGPPDQAPGLNVQVIAYRDPEVGNRLQAIHDYYWFESGLWAGGDLFGLWYYLQKPGLKVVKFGATLARDDFMEIYRKAKNDPDLPAKTGRARGEPA